MPAHTSLQVLDGSVSNPSYTFHLDTNTGFYRKSGDLIGIVANGVEVATIGTSGLVPATGVVTGLVGDVRGVTTSTATSTLTLTAAMLVPPTGGIIVHDPSGGAATDTTDTAANIIAALPANFPVGGVFTCYFLNHADAAEAITLAGGTDVTIVNLVKTLAQNTETVMVFRRTSATAFSVYLMGPLA